MYTSLRVIPRLGTTECGRGGDVVIKDRIEIFACRGRGWRKVLTFINLDEGIWEWVTNDETYDVEAIGGAGSGDVEMKRSGEVLDLFVVKKSFSRSLLVLCVRRLP